MKQAAMERLPGISFMVDEESNRIVIVLDREKYGQAWEDFYDSLLLSLSEKEETLSLDEFKTQMQAEERL